MVAEINATGVQLFSYVEYCIPLWKYVLGVKLITV